MLWEEAVGREEEAPVVGGWWSPSGRWVVAGVEAAEVNVLETGRPTHTRIQHKKKE